MATTNELLFTNRYTSYSREEALHIAEQYNAFLKEKGYKEEDYSFREWFSVESSSKWEDFMLNLEESENDRQCTLIGFDSFSETIIEPVVYSTISEAIIASTERFEYVTIWKTKKCLKIEATYYDRRTNIYNIYLLNKKGIECAKSYNSKADFSNKAYHLVMPKALY